MSNQRKISQRLMFIIGAFASLLVLIATPVNATQLATPSGICGGTGTVICIDPATQTLEQNKVTTVDIRIENIPVIPDDLSLYGADVRLSFDRSILCARDGSHPCPNTSNAVTITPGPLLTQTDAFCSSSCYFILTNNADNTAGSITFILTRLRPAHSISGSGVLATITFYGLASGSSQIHFTNAQLVDRNGGQIPTTQADGTIDVFQFSTAVKLSGFEARTENRDTTGTMDWTLVTIAAIFAVVSGVSYGLVRRRMKNQRVS